MRSHSALSWLSIFTSSSTLVCCALPAMLVVIGAGAALSGLISAVPQIVWLSEHKIPVFAGAGVMIACAGTLQWRARTRFECPADSDLGAACRSSKDISVWVWWISLAIYAAGAFFAFGAPLLL
jgi:hypothetical protein